MTVTIKANTENFPKVVLDSLPGIKTQDETDLIICAAQKIENLTKEQAYHHAEKLSDSRGYMAFHLGGVLGVIHINHWHWGDGYNHFGKFVEERFGISRSTAYDYMNIYSNIVESGVSYDVVSEVGWTKLRLFAHCLTKENCSKWIETASKLNAGELREYVKKSVSKKQSQLTNKPDVSDVSTHVDKADVSPNSTEQSSESGAEVNTATSQEVNMVPKSVAENTHITVTFKLVPDQKEIVDLAIDSAMEANDTNSKGTALGYICMEYLNSCDIGKPAVSTDK